MAGSTPLETPTGSLVHARFTYSVELAKVQQMLDHARRLLHLSQDLSNQWFGPGDAVAMEAGVDAARTIPEP